MNSSRRSLSPPEEDYFSVEDILASNERVPCRFEIPVSKLGFLDPSSESSDVKAGTKLELPLWMAQGLHSGRVIAVDLPKVYKEGYREILNADADVVDLHKLGPYFYHFGLYILRFSHHDTEDVAGMLNQTFRHRFRRLMDISQNSLDEDVSLLTSRLDQTEQALFNIGQKSLYDLTNWQSRRTQKIETADLVVNHRKRRRAILAETTERDSQQEKFKRTA